MINYSFPHSGDFPAGIPTWFEPKTMAASAGQDLRGAAIRQGPGGVGRSIRPRKRRVPERFSRMTKKNGRSAWNRRGMLTISASPAVTAAASVPFSSIRK